MIEIDFDVPFSVPLAHIISLAHPAHDDVWGCGVITKEDVLHCGDLELGKYHADDVTTEVAESWDYNVSRIRYLMDNAWNDNYPITLDMGMDFYRPYPILDGNHRIAAAIFRGDELILVEAMGDIEIIERVLINGEDEEKAW